MRISENYKKLISDEIDYVAVKMQESVSAEEKLYYFSGLHGIIYRVFNIEYDTDLVFLHFILHQVYTAFQQRLTAITKGGDSIIPITENHFDKLVKITKDLVKRIKKDEDISSILKELVVLAYTTTGNGYYLVQKGLIRI